MFYTTFQNEKTPFQAIKTRTSKNRKIDLFPKGLTHAFGPKMAILATFFSGNIGQENVFYDIQERKNAFLGYKNKKIKTSKHSHFPMVLVQKWPFWQLFFLGSIGRENVFYYILNEKRPFQAIKTRRLKSRKIEIFPNGLTHGFGPKMAILATFFFKGIQAIKISLRYSRRKKRLSSLSKQEVQKVEILTFFQRG